MRKQPEGKVKGASLAKTFKRGDHVEWNSEAGRVRGVIVRSILSDVWVNGYVHHASKDDPQYVIKSDQTDHVAIHKGQALTHVTRNHFKIVVSVDTMTCTTLHAVAAR